MLCNKCNIVGDEIHYLFKCLKYESQFQFLKTVVRIQVFLLAIKLLVVMISLPYRHGSETNTSSHHCTKMWITFHVYTHLLLVKFQVNVMFQTESYVMILLFILVFVIHCVNVIPKK